MVEEAIREEGGRKGLSLAAIKKYVHSTHEGVNETRLKHTVQNMEENGEIHHNVRSDCLPARPLRLLLRLHAAGLSPSRTSRTHAHLHPPPYCRSRLTLAPSAWALAVIMRTPAP